MKMAYRDPNYTEIHVPAIHYQIAIWLQICALWVFIGSNEKPFEIEKFAEVRGAN